jgi:cob(I)alamin adenosyltransferase
MPKYFTGNGDDGTTGLLGEGRVKKFDVRMETLGTIDELSAFLGLARSLSRGDECEILKKIQATLYEMMAELAATEENQTKYRKIGEDHIQFLEKYIEELSKIVKSPRGFILPGDTREAASLSVARTVCRRAERRVVELVDEGIVTNKFLQAYLNRLSSLLFVMEVKAASEGNGTPTAARGQD